MANLVQEIEIRVKELLTEFEDIQNKIEPLERRRGELKEKIEAFNRILELEGTKTKITEDSKEATKLQPETEGLGAKEIFKFFIKEHFANKSFREGEIRTLVTDEGFRVNGNPIAGSYSRSLINNLHEEGFLKKVKRGLYRVKQENSPA
jgi:chromosome segregation ATPase